MELEITRPEIKLIKKLLKKHLLHVKTEISLAEIFELQNKLNNLIMCDVVVSKDVLCGNCEKEIDKTKPYCCECGCLIKDYQ